MDAQLGIYLTVKLAAYTAWCALGLKLAGRPLGLRAVRLGLLRTALGIGFGFLIFFLASALPLHGTLGEYIALYAPVRVVEWAILWVLIRGAGGPGFIGPRALLWIAGGILVSYAADLASPIPVDERFCIGRCLC
jgi:hypothetical protein